MEGSQFLPYTQETFKSSYENFYTISTELIGSSKQRDTDMKSEY